MRAKDLHVSVVQPDKTEADKAGLCFDESEVALACTVNTAVGAKLGPAFATCSTDTDQATGRKKGGKGKGKGTDFNIITKIERTIQLLG